MESLRGRATGCLYDNPGNKACGIIGQRSDLTALDLFLDILTKSGIGALASLLNFCMWIVQTAYLKMETRCDQSLPGPGVSCLLLVFCRLLSWRISLGKRCSLIT